MRVFALELDDRAISLARDGQVLTIAPSAVFDGSGGGAAGTNAWHELRTRPMSTSSRHLGAVLAQRDLSARSESLVLAELKTRLEEQPCAADERLWIVTPARAEPKGLEALLGITRRLDLPVDGFVDSATITTAALGSERNAIVLELGLHHAAATAVDRELAQARRRRTVLTHRGGILELWQVWLDLISTTMVKRTRFDPLHDAATEQQLFGAIPALTREAAATGETNAAVTKGHERFEIALTRDQFAQAAEPIYRAIVALLHQLRPAGNSCDIVMPSQAAELPGMRALLEQFVGCELVAVPDGFAAAAASVYDLPRRSPEETSVRMLRRLPLRALVEPPASIQLEARADTETEAPIQPEARADTETEAPIQPEARADTETEAPIQPEARADTAPQAPIHPGALAPARALSAEAVIREELGRRRAGGPAPSHVLLEGRAYSLNTDSLVVGRTLGSVQLPDGLAGVSRRHCTFVRDGEQLVLLDHSTFGTYVNGERVHERVRVYAGDRIRLGEPGVELALIAVGEVTAAAEQP